MMKDLCVSLVLIALVSATASAKVIQLDNDQLQALIDKGVPVVDVRREEEWRATGIVPTSELMTFFDAKGRHKSKEWLAALQAVATSDKPVVLICRSGNRTRTISRWLSEQVGYETVYNVTHGIIKWRADGRAVAAMP